MTEISSDDFFIKHRRTRMILLILLPFLIIPCFFLVENGNLLLASIGVILIFLVFIDIGIAIGILTKNHYNWIIAFLVLIIIGFVFRRYRFWLTGTFLTFGFGCLGTVSLFSSRNFLKRYRHDPFLRYIGFASSIVLFTVSLGLLWRNMHWPFTNLFINIGLITFIPFLVAFIFTLPNANFLNWSKNERVVFYRAIIIPMIFVYILCVMIVVFPELWTSLTRLPLLPFGMDPSEIILK